MVMTSFKVYSKLLLSVRDACCRQNKRHYAQVVPWTKSQPKRQFPPYILRPEYADTTEPESIRGILIKTPSELVGIEKACRTAKTILNRVGKRLSPGVRGEEIDDWVYEDCLFYNCYPSPLNYRGFPKCVTVSVNNVAVHAIPDRRPLEEGDMVKVDVSIYLDGYHGDCCSTFPIGHVDEEAQELIRVTRESLHEAIAICRSGIRLSEIGSTIESYVSRNSTFSVIPNLCGHGLGRYFHEPPQVLHYCHDSAELLQENMVITIEPVLCVGSPQVFMHTDGWTISTLDGSRVAQFEEALHIQKTCATILTREFD